MAIVQLSRSEAEGKGTLPAVCIYCGAPAITSVAKEVTDFKGGKAGGNDPLLFLPVVLVLDALAWKVRDKATVHIPVCERHRNGVPSGTGFKATAVTNERITLGGVSDAFARALEDHRAGRHAGGRHASGVLDAVPVDEEPQPGRRAGSWVVVIILGVILAVVAAMALLVCGGVALVKLAPRKPDTRKLTPDPVTTSPNKQPEKPAEKLEP